MILIIYIFTKHHIHYKRRPRAQHATKGSTQELDLSSHSGVYATSYRVQNTHTSIDHFRNLGEILRNNVDAFD